MLRKSLQRTSSSKTSKHLSNDAQHARSCILADELATPLEILANLAFLTMEGSERPDEVRMYMRMAEEQLSLLRLLASCNPNMANQVAIIHTAAL